MLLVLAGGVAAAAAPQIVLHGDRAVPRVALTFDLCPTKKPVELDERIVAALVAADARATFFVSGRWAEALPNAVRRLAGDPRFEIGGHGFRHPHLTTLPDAAVRSDLERTQSLLETLTGRAPRVWRPPYGEIDARVAGIAASLGLVTIEYDVVSGDPSPGAKRDALVRTVLGAAKNGSIIVMHANHRRFATADAVPAIVEGLRARGLTLVTVSELLAAPPVEASGEIR